MICGISAKYKKNGGLQEENFSLVDKAFKLLFSNDCLSVELYKCYLQYMQDKRLSRCVATCRPHHKCMNKLILCAFRICAGRL